MKISNKTKNKLNGSIEDMKKNYKDMFNNFFEIMKDKKFQKIFLSMIFVFISAQIYAVTNWKNVSDLKYTVQDQNTQENEKEVKEENKEEKEIVTFAQIMQSKIGYRVKAPFGKDLAQETLAGVLILGCGFMPLFYIPYFISPLLALNLSVISNLYMSYSANGFYLILAVALKIIAFSFAIALGSVIYRNEKNKYKMKSMKAYNSYDFRASVCTIFGKEDKAKKYIKTKENKKNLYNEKIKKFSVNNLVIALLILIILFSISKICLMFSL